MRSSVLLNPNIQLTICVSVGITKDRTGPNIATHVWKKSLLKCLQICTSGPHSSSRLLFSHGANVTLLFRADWDLQQHLRRVFSHHDSAILYPSMATASKTTTHLTQARQSAIAVALLKNTGFDGKSSSILCGLQLKSS